MVVNFSKIEFNERPVLILKNASNAPLGILAYAENISVDLKYNEVSSIEFTIPEYVDGNSVPFYHDIAGMRIVELLDIGQFTLVDPSEQSDGVRSTKSCKGYSLEYEFTYKKISLPENTYKFWDLASNGDTLLGMIMELMPNWNIGAVSDSLLSKYRTFEVNNENLYNLIKGTVQKSYGCIFDFDTINRLVYIRDASESPASTAVYISSDNLAKEIEITEDTESIITRLDVNGAEGVSIRDVNPGGTNRIINLDYYMTEDNFESSLIAKYNAWKSLFDENRQPYYLLSVRYAIKIAQRTTENAKLTDLQGELTSLENLQAVAIEGIARGLKTQADLDAANKSIRDKQSEITAKQAEISSIQSEIDSFFSQLKSISDQCKFENYFTAEELKLLDRYIKDGEISESSFVVSEIDSYEDGGNGVALDGLSVSISSSNITEILSSGGQKVYDIRGGTITGNGLTADIISATIDQSTSGKIIATLYLSTGTIDGNEFPGGCMSLTSGNGQLSVSDGSMSITLTEAYRFFSLNASEYEKRSVAWELFEYGNDVLSKLASPSYTFNVSSENFLALSEFEAFKSALSLGDKIYVNLNSRGVLQPIVIGVSFAYDDPQSIEFQFSDSFSSGDSTFKLVDLLEQSISMGKNVEMSKYIYSSFVDSGASTGIRQFMTSALDVSRNAIMSSSQQAISWDGAGFRLRKWANEARTSYEPEQIWMNNNSIVMTSDNWATAQMAIGKFHDENLGDCWGIVAPRIVGTLVAGTELIIESSKKDGGVSVFRVDGSGVRLYNGDLSVMGNNTHIALNPYLGIAIGTYPVYSVSGETYTMNENNAKFWVDTSGNLHFKGTLHAANGEFTGSVTATSLIIKGSEVDVYVGGKIDTAVEPLEEDVQNAQNTANAAQTAAGNAQNSANAAQNTANNAQSAASAAQSSANSAQATANQAVTDASNALSAANVASTTATNARSMADSIYNGTKGIYFTSSSVSKVQIDTANGIKVTGTDNAYFQVKNNAMGFFKSDGSAMLYYENGNMVLTGIISAAGSYIGGTSGWVVGADCIYNKGASSLGKAGGIYMGTDGISVGSAIVMKPDGSFLIRADNTSTSTQNYAFKIEPSTLNDGSVAYNLHIGANITFDDSFVLPMEHGGTGGIDRESVGNMLGMYRITNEAQMSGLTNAINGDLCVLYSAGAQGASISGSFTTSPGSSPGYLAIGGYSGSHSNDYFGLTNIAYWNFRGLSGEESISTAYGRVGVGHTVSGAGGLFVPISVTVSNTTEAVTSVVVNFTFNLRPSGCSRDLCSEWTNSVKVAVYKNDTTAALAGSTYSIPTSWKTASNTDRAASVSLNFKTTGLTTGTYYVVFYTSATKSLMWIKPSSVTIPTTNIGAAHGIYLKTGGQWKALMAVTD